MVPDVDAINRLLQRQLRDDKRHSVAHDDASGWLARAGLIEDDRHHQVLGKLCREGVIEGAESEGSGLSWRIWLTPTADELRADGAALREWLESHVTAVKAVADTASQLRRRAQDLVNDPSGQEPRREVLEQQVLGLRVTLLRKVSELKPLASLRATFSGELKTEYARRLLAADEAGRDVVPDSVKRLAEWPLLERERAGLKGVVEGGLARYEELRITTAGAADRAMSVADAAIRRSIRVFDQRVESPMALAAGVPIVAFLLVAAVGAKAPTTPLATAMSVGFLLLSTGFAFAVAWRQKTRARSMAMVGVASSLAVFTAAYLIASWADPESITLWAQPLPFIGEAAMLSLTLGATGGTLSVELARAARVIAFIQILMTVTVVVAALTWGWRRLLRSREEDTARQ